jgi:hypothetical protein
VIRFSQDGSPGARAELSMQLRRIRALEDTELFQELVVAAGKRRDSLCREGHEKELDRMGRLFCRECQRHGAPAA